MTGLYATNNCISVRTCTQKMIFMRDGIRKRKIIAMKHETNLNVFPSPTQACVVELWKARPYSVTTNCLYVLY